jgi:nicotinamidase/pyrazinamidase
VANTIRDIVKGFDPASVSKLVLLTDAMSDVPNPPGTTLFTDLGEAFMRDLTALGAQTSTTTDFLK